MCGIGSCAISIPHSKRCDTYKYFISLRRKNTTIPKSQRHGNRACNLPISISLFQTRMIHSLDIIASLLPQSIANNWVLLVTKQRITTQLTIRNFMNIFTKTLKEVVTQCMYSADSLVRIVLKDTRNMKVTKFF